MKLLFVTYGTKNVEIAKEYTFNFKLDCKTLPNPHAYFIKEDGLSPNVIKFFESALQQKSNVFKAYILIKDLFFKRLNYLKTHSDLNSTETLCVGITCFGGRHRSVFMAEDIAKTVRESGDQVCVKHLVLGLTTGDRYE